jgi:hypothetical protein
MEKGVLLMAFNSPSYIYMAAQLALSIKYNDPDLPIQIVHDGNIGYLPEAYRIAFDHYTPIKESDFIVDGKFEPGLAKLKAYDYSIFDKTIYLDVDALAINPISDLFEDCNSFYLTEVIDKGGKNDKIGYSHWAENSEVWNYFGLTEEAVFCSTQSSFQYFEKGDSAQGLYEFFDKNFSFPKERLKNHWGGSMPDELIVSASCAQYAHDPAIGVPVVYFGNANNRKEIAEIQENYKILSLYGNGNGTTLVSGRYLDWYDRMTIKRFKKFGLRPIKKSWQLMKGKHVN